MAKQQARQRQVRLQPKYREQVRGVRIVPWLTISGVWLEELGFKAGGMVRIRTAQGQLIIEPLTAEEQAAHCHAAVLGAAQAVLKKLAR